MDKKEIEVVNGDGKDLNISPVYEHLEVEKPKEKENKDKIIIPEEKNRSLFLRAYFSESFMLSIFRYILYFFNYIAS